MFSRSSLCVLLSDYWCDLNHAGKAVKLSEGQRAAVIQAATSPVCVLTGGPGCGKTTTTKYIVDLWTTMNKKVALCAPTGWQTLLLLRLML